MQNHKDLYEKTLKCDWGAGGGGVVGGILTSIRENVAKYLDRG